jgi:putative ABC transport system permease protein
MILADGFTSVLLGVVGGLSLSLVLTPLLAGMLFGVRPGSLANYTVILLLLLLVSIFAALLPARRAMNIDPLTALRYE